MVCTFFGHKDVSDSIKNALKDAIITLIEKEGVKTFYVGNNGRFDFLVQKVLQEIVTLQTNIQYNIILSSMDEKAIGNNQDATIFPEGFEKTLPKFAVFKRNEWLIKHSTFVIAYAKYKTSNSYKWVEKAIRKGLRVINLADLQ